MKTILIPFRDDDHSDAALRTAHAVAKRYDSHIVGLFVIPEPQLISAGAAIPGVYLAQMAEDGDRQAAAAKQRFEQSLNTLNIVASDLDSDVDGVSASWLETRGIESQVIGEHGRLFDLIVIGRSEDGHWNTACEAALFDSGRPVLVAADTIAEQFEQKVLIAWNASTETARTVALGMPLMSRAQHVTVLNTPGASVPGPDGSEFAQHLRRNGINATHDTVESVGGDGTGEAILDYVRRNDFTLLLKGAYTHTRLRQIVFGGATRNILNNAQIPVLLAH